jgi:hypothetical protein
VDGYFTTEQEKAKNWDMLQEAKAHKASMSRLRNEGRQVSKPWRVLCDALDDLDTYVARFDDEKITILRLDRDRPGASGCTIPASEVAVIPISPGELKPIRQLFESFRESKMSAARVACELKDIDEAL